MTDEIEDFVEEECTSSSDLFDCEYTSIDAVINQIVVFTGCIERQTENGTRLLVAYGEGSTDPLSTLTVRNSVMCSWLPIVNIRSERLSRL